MTRIVKKFKKKDNTHNIDGKKLNEDISFLPDGEYTIIIEPLSKDSILKKRNYYFLCVEELGRFLGYTKNEMQEELKQHLSKDIIIENGQEVEKPKSIATMTDIELIERIRELHQFAALNFDFTFPNSE